MEPRPTTMRAFVAPKYCKPDEYEVIQLPVPDIKAPDEILIRMHAVAIETSDCLVARRKTLLTMPFPMVLGHEGAGVVVRVGSGVKSFKPGDAVYGTGVKHPMGKLWEKGQGWCADYTITTEDLLLPKPPQLSFEEAASLLGSTLTAVQFIPRAMALNPAAFPNGSLEGKTVLVTAGLGGSTSVAAQVIKNVFGAKEVITTVSTAKVPLLERLMPGVIDKAVDYQTQDVVREIGKGRVDFLYNSRADVTSYFPLMEPNNGVIAAILAVPPSRALKESMGPEFVPFWLSWLLDLAQLWYKWKLWGTNVKMIMRSANPGVREDLERAGEVIATGKVKAVISVYSLDDVETMKKKCEEVLRLKGAVGKLVIKLR